MKINIFQIDDEKDKHGVMYQNLDAIEGFQGTKDIQSEIYDKVFDGEVDCNPQAYNYKIYKPHGKAPTSLHGLYVHYCFLLGIYPKERPQSSVACDYLKEEKMRVQKLSEEAAMMGKYGIEDMEQLREHYQSVSMEVENRQKFEQHSLLELQGDMLDRYRAEYNHILTENVGQSNGIMQDKYLTVTIEKGSPEEARSYFSRVGAEFSSLFASLGSRIEEVDREEKLRIFFDFFHYGSEEDFHFDASLYDRRGYSFKDAIAPDSFEFRSDYFKVDGRYGRVMYLRDYANYIKDSFMAELTDIDRGLMLLPVGMWIDFKR